MMVDKIFIDASRADEFEDIIAASYAPIFYLSSQVMKSLTDTQTPQGVVAEIEIPPAKLYKHKPENRILILDRISDPGNMGTIIRTAMATGFYHIFVIDCVDAFSPKVVRSSSGAVLGVNIYPTSTDEILSIAQNNDICMLVADMKGQNAFEMARPVGSVAIVVGNEGQGVCQSIKDKGRLIKLPMKKEIESLNAGVSASILMYLLEGKNI